MCNTHVYQKWSNRDACYKFFNNTPLQKTMLMNVMNQILLAIDIDAHEKVILYGQNYNEIVKCIFANVL